MTSPRLAEDTGRELGERYRLVAPVGVGTSSRVFLAVDTQLRGGSRWLLHEALAEDEAFLRRFRAEARAAGALSHPSIVAVFDWGEDRTEDGTVVPYLVTEFLGGGSLRGILDRGEPLSPSQTIVVGLDAARALAHAHQRGLVHRDVKPGNLLFDDDGRLRLADFGLARALAEASWTEPSGVTIGTARYASPEQALGRRLDGRSDVYSLALILVECLTGRVPFTGDTAATLAAHPGRHEPEPSRPAVRARACRPPDPAAAGHAELEIALMAAAEGLPRPDPLPLVPTLMKGVHLEHTRPRGRRHLRRVPTRWWSTNPTRWSSSRRVRWPIAAGLTRSSSPRSTTCSRVSRPSWSGRPFPGEPLERGTPARGCAASGVQTSQPGRRRGATAARRSGAPPGGRGGGAAWWFLIRAGARRADCMTVRRPGGS